MLKRQLTFNAAWHRIKNWIGSLCHSLRPHHFTPPSTSFALVVFDVLRICWFTWLHAYSWATKNTGACICWPWV